MAAISAVIIREAFEQLEDNTLIDAIVTMEDSKVSISTYNSDLLFELTLDRSEWEAINKLAQDEFKRIDSLPAVGKGFDK